MWNYKREEAPKLESGDYRVAIANVEESTSRAGNPMLIITVQPNGSNIKIKHYIVKNEYFNRNMTDFFDAFPEIDEGDFNFLGWIGCVGAARLKEDDNGYLKVAYFLKPDKAANLPEWQGKRPERQTVTDINIKADDPEDDLPF